MGSEVGVKGHFMFSLMRGVQGGTRFAKGYAGFDAMGVCYGGGVFPVYAI